VEWIIPIEKYGVRILSVGLFVKPEDAVVWRGPMATSALKQLISQGDWGELDYLLIDLPPGTGDVHLTMVQEVPVTGVVIVSTPQEVALADVIKGINMFAGEKINVPVLGLVENMSWFTPEELPDNRYYIFGKDGCKNLAEKLGVPLLGQIPIVQGIREGGDSGRPVALSSDEPSGNAFRLLSGAVRKALERRNAEKAPTKKVEITIK
jgi:ATP-binding protein involved in chromosome partitioning